MEQWLSSSDERDSVGSCWLLSRLSGSTISGYEALEKVSCILQFPVILYSSCPLFEATWVGLFSLPSWNSLTSNSEITAWSHLLKFGSHLLVIPWNLLPQVINAICGFSGCQRQIYLQILKGCLKADLVSRLVYGQTSQEAVRIPLQANFAYKLNY